MESGMGLPLQQPQPCGFVCGRVWARGGTLMEEVSGLGLTESQVIYYF